jgi:hypothetical protein
MQLAGVHQEVQAGHLRHPEVRDDHGDRFPVGAQLFQQRHGTLRRLVREYPVVRAEAAAQRTRELRDGVTVVVNHHEGRPDHPQHTNASDSQRR